MPLQQYVTATPVAATATATATASSYTGEPYAAAAAAPLLSTSSTKKKKKKSSKKQNNNDANTTTTNTGASYVTGAASYVDGFGVSSEVELTTNSYSNSNKPSSSKSTSSSKKSSKKKKKDKKNKNATPAVTQQLAQSHVVLKASGWKQLKTRDINSRHAADAAQHKYAITGDESQIVTVAIPPGETCQGEPGSMMYLTSPIYMRVSCGSDWFGRCCGGESCCVLNFKNKTNETGYAALVTNEPLAKVVPVELNSPEVGGSLIVQQGAYMASYGDVKITFSCDFNFVRCCCGGMGLVRQKIEGTGTAFLGATGTIVQKVLEEGEVMLMDTNCILAYSETCTFDLKKTGGIVNWIGGGEGFFNSSLKGPGLVIVQSMNMIMLLESLAANKMYRR